MTTERPPTPPRRGARHRPYRRVDASRGRRLLIAVLQVTTGREVAARCGVSPSSISMWLSDVHTPGERVRAVLERCYAIPRDAWDEPARKP